MEHIINSSASDQIRMPCATLLVEGIDGSGKDEFVKMLRLEIQRRFVHSENETLSIVGQPAFRFDETGKVRALVERGEPVCSLNEAIHHLSENRRIHEEYLTRYRGIVVCLRGILTERATLARLFGCSDAGNLGQTRPIDLLIVIDTDTSVAFERILKRTRPCDWRETPENLPFFRQFYLDSTMPSCVRKKIVYLNNKGLEDLAVFAQTVANELVNFSMLNSPNSYE